MKTAFSLYTKHGNYHLVEAENLVVALNSLGLTIGDVQHARQSGEQEYVWVIDHWELMAPRLKTAIALVVLALLLAYEEDESHVAITDFILDDLMTERGETYHATLYPSFVQHLKKAGLEVTTQPARINGIMQNVHVLRRQIDWGNLNLQKIDAPYLMQQAADYAQSNPESAAKTLQGL